MTSLSSITLVAVGSVPRLPPATQDPAGEGTPLRPALRQTTADHVRFACTDVRVDFTGLVTFGGKLVWVDARSRQRLCGASYVAAVVTWYCAGIGKSTSTVEDSYYKLCAFRELPDEVYFNAKIGPVRALDGRCLHR